MLVSSMAHDTAIDHDGLALMNPPWLRLGALMSAVAGASATGPASVSIPSIPGTLTMDGITDEAAWHGARPVTLIPSEFGLPFPAGGETCISTQGAYLCLSARIPEPDRVVAHSSGRDPKLWAEGLITWTFRIHAAALCHNLNISLAVNPLGAWRFQNAATMEPPEGGEEVLVAAHIGAGERSQSQPWPRERHSGRRGLHRRRVGM